LSQCLQTGGSDGFEHSEDKLSLVRLHYRQKHYDEVLEMGRKFLELEGIDHGTEPARSLRLECLEMMGFAYKRRNLFAEMQETWELLLSDAPFHVTARLELAKHLEHRAKDLGRALELCVEALDNPRASGSAVMAEEFARRRERLEAKLARGGAGDLLGE